MLDAFQGPNKTSKKENRDERAASGMQINFNLRKQKADYNAIRMRETSLGLFVTRRILVNTSSQNLIASLIASVAVLQMAERKKP